MADYPFTTLEPNLGVVLAGDKGKEESFVVADIPGLIEGAHAGSGLGTQFLRHIERTRLLVHMVDVSDGSGRPDVVKDVEVILGELASFGADLEKKPTVDGRVQDRCGESGEAQEVEGVGDAEEAEALSDFGGDGRGDREVEVCDGAREVEKVRREASVQSAAIANSHLQVSLPKRLRGASFTLRPHKPSNRTYDQLVCLTLGEDRSDRCGIYGIARRNRSAMMCARSAER